jgi:hypothetical protein
MPLTNLAVLYKVLYCFPKNVVNATTKGVRKVMTVEQKINILDKLECGGSIAVVKKLV